MGVFGRPRGIFICRDGDVVGERDGIASCNIETSKWAYVCMYFTCRMCMIQQHLNFSLEEQSYE
jgi:hypothetical protein